MGLRVYSDIVKRAVENFGDKTAMIISRDGKYKCWSFNQFKDQVNAVAEALVDRGFSRTSRGIVIGANTPEWVIAYHAIFFAGSCTVPVDPNLPADELEEILARSEAEAVFCDAQYLPFFERLREKYPKLTTVVQLVGSSPKNQSVTFSELIARGNGTFSLFDRQFQPDDPMAVLFTSGTTGQSKGVVLTQKNFCGPAEYGFDMMGVTSEDRVMAVLPLYHVFGFAATIAGGMMNGVDVVFIAEIKGPLIVKAMNDLRVTTLPAVPQMLTLMLESILRNVSEKGVITRKLFELMLKLSGTLYPVLGRSFQRKLFKQVHEGFGGKFCKIISGGASLDPHSYRIYQNLGFDIVEGYGLTETFGPVTLCPVAGQVQGSVGVIMGENEVKIASPDEDGWGEVLFRGDSVFQGYLNDREKTAAVFDDEGWFCTGDRGRLDSQGYLTLSGRLKDIIVLDSGKNVYPDELEHYYESSHLIEEIAVFALNENGVTTVGAVVVPVPLHRAGSMEEMVHDIEAEMKRLSANRPDYKRVASFVCSEHALPRTSTKKLQKHLLPDLYRELKKGVAIVPTRVTAVDTLLMESPVYQAVCSSIRDVADHKISEDELTPERELLTDLGIDSLRLLELAALIEKKFGVVIDENDLITVTTIADLVKLVEDAKPGTALSLSEQLHLTEETPEEFSDKLGIAASIALWAMKNLSRLLWGLKIEGVENIPADGPLIFAANHESMFDGFWVYSALPGMIRKRSYVLLKSELAKARFLSHLGDGINYIPVERDGDILTPLRRAFFSLKAGKNILIFPEGTRSTDGEVHQFRSGVGILLRETDARVVPVSLINANSKWPKGKYPQIFEGWKERPLLRIGAPLTLSELGHTKESSEVDIAAAIRDRVVSQRGSH